MKKAEIEKIIRDNDETLAAMMRDQISFVAKATGKSQDWSRQLINELSDKVMTSNECDTDSVVHEYTTLIDNETCEYVFRVGGLTGLMNWNASGKTKLYDLLLWYAKAYKAQVVLKTSALLLLATGQYD